MWFWWFMFACNLMMPVLFVICGRWMWKSCPKNINSFLGYRSRRSMKNQDTWRFAHEYCGKLWWKIGWILMAPTVLVQLPVYHSNEEVIGSLGGILVTVQCVLLICTIFATEHALKKEFGKAN